MTREEAEVIMEKYLEEPRDIPLPKEKLSFFWEDEFFFYFSHGEERRYGVHKPTGDVLPLPR